MDQLNVMIGQHLAVFGVILLAVVVLFLIMLVLFITTRSKMSALQKNMTSLPMVRKPILMRF